MTHNGRLGVIRGDAHDQLMLVVRPCELQLGVRSDLAFDEERHADAGPVSGVAFLRYRRPSPRTPGWLPSMVSSTCGGNYEPIGCRVA